MQTRWKTVIMTDCFTFTCYFSITFPEKGRLILSKKKKKEWMESPNVVLYVSV